MLSGICLRGSTQIITIVATFSLALPIPAHAIEFGAVETVTYWLNDTEYPVIVTGYSVPSFADWDSDGLEDLVVGGGSGTYTPKVRVYLNEGTAQAPKFAAPFYAQSGGADLTATGSGCMGLFPRVCYWDGDGLKDLVVGNALGGITFFRNTGSDTNPTFDGGTLLQVGASGAKIDIDIGSRACIDILDWNNDGRKDLVAGDLNSNISVFLNVGTDTSPDFLAETFVMDGGSTMVVPGYRASPAVADLNGDGAKDILAGNTDGQLLFYANVGTDASPLFDGYSAVLSDGLAIDLTASRSRPGICDWTGDGLWDVLVGASDGYVYLYQGIPEPCSAALLGIGCWVVLRKRRKPAVGAS